MDRKTASAVLCMAAAAMLSSCSPRIYGRVHLLDSAMRPVATDNAQGTVINMINTTASLEQASHSVVADGKGEFSSAKDAILPGKYKVEASRIGYETQSQDVEIGRFTRKKLTINLKKVDEGTRKAIEGMRSDENKIINPGEVNLQPPSM